MGPAAGAYGLLRIMQPEVRRTRGDSAPKPLSTNRVRHRRDDGDATLRLPLFASVKTITLTDVRFRKAIDRSRIGHGARPLVSAYDLEPARLPMVVREPSPSKRAENSTIRAAVLASYVVPHSFLIAASRSTG